MTSSSDFSVRASARAGVVVADTGTLPMWMSDPDVAGDEPSAPPLIEAAAMIRSRIPTRSYADRREQSACSS